MKLACQYMVIFFNLSPYSNQLHPLQVENCDSNSRLVLDEGDNGKLRLERVNIHGHIVIALSSWCTINKTYNSELFSRRHTKVIQKLIFSQIDQAGLLFLNIYEYPKSKTAIQLTDMMAQYGNVETWILYFYYISWTGTLPVKAIVALFYGLYSHHPTPISLCHCHIL